jgi:exodeoxyribonuclease-3
VYRTLNPEEKDVYTYWDQKTRARDRNVGWRIDYFFCTPEFFERVKSFKTLNQYFGSDHCPIMIELS